MNEKRTVYENIFILIIGCITGLLIYTNFKEPQIKEGTEYNETRIQLSTGDKITQSGKKRIIEGYRDNTKHNELSKGTRQGYAVKSTIKNGDSKVQSTKLMSGSRIIVKGFNSGDLAQKIVNYAWKLSNGNIDFLMTLKAENGGFDMYKQSNCYQNGIREQSYGLCMLNRRRHKEVDTKIFWDSWQYQLELCWQKYSQGTRFYGFDVRERYRDNFIIK